MKNKWRETDRFPKRRKEAFPEHYYIKVNNIPTVPLTSKKHNILLSLIIVEF